MAAPSPNAAVPAATAGSDLRLRLISAVVLGAVAVACAWLGGWPAALLLTVVAAIVAWEWAGIVARGAPAVAVGVMVVLAGAAVLFAEAELALPALVVAVSGAAIIGVVTRNGWLTAGVLYAASLGVALVLLRDDPVHGLASIAFVLGIVWASDTGAYVAGRAIGGPKLWPRVSPKKTWSGFVGGTLAGVVTAVIVALVAGVAVTATLVVIAALLAVVSAGGDLFESALKRRYGVKDSSAIIPGHGGLMDRVDGLTAAAVLAAIIGFAHGGPDRLGQGLLLW